MDANTIKKYVDGCRVLFSNNQATAVELEALLKSFEATKKKGTVNYAYAEWKQNILKAVSERRLVTKAYFLANVLVVNSIREKTSEMKNDQLTSSLVFGQEPSEIIDMLKNAETQFKYMKEALDNYASRQKVEDMGPCGGSTYRLSGC